MRLDVLFALLLVVGCASPRGPQPVYLDVDPKVAAAVCREHTGKPTAWACSNTVTGIIVCPNDWRNAACRTHEARHLADPAWRHADDEPIRAPWSVDEFMGRPWRVAR